MYSNNISLFFFSISINCLLYFIIIFHTRSRFSSILYISMKQFLTSIDHITNLNKLKSVAKAFFIPLNSWRMKIVLMHNLNNGYICYGSAFASLYISPYEIYSIGNKETYCLTTIWSDGKWPGLLRNPINWLHLHCYVSEGDNEFFVKENVET